MDDGFRDPNLDLNGSCFSDADGFQEPSSLLLQRPLPRPGEGRLPRVQPRGRGGPRLPRPPPPGGAPRGLARPLAVRSAGTGHK